jgi:hypothetical protein
MTGMAFRRLSKIAHMWRYKIAMPVPRTTSVHWCSSGLMSVNGTDRLSATPA